MIVRPCPGCGIIKSAGYGLRVSSEGRERTAKQDSKGIEP